MQADNQSTAILNDITLLASVSLSVSEVSILLCFAENFQDQEIYFPSKHCLQHLLKNLSHEYCGAPFHTAMQSVSTAKWCVLKNVIR